MLTNAGARAGDVLFLTKPLGTGIVGTAIKFDRVDAALADEAVRSMRTLNRAAAEALRTLPAGAVHACTDITGFGLIGHATEMARASGVTLTIDAGTRPGLSRGAGDRRREPFRWHDLEPGAFRRRRRIRRGHRCRPAKRVLYDPQTSGGLLVAVSAESADQAAAAFAAAGVAAARIGTAGRPVPGVQIVAKA